MTPPLRSIRMAYKIRELFEIFDKLNEHLTRSQDILKYAANVNEEVDNDTGNFLIWAIRNIRTPEKIIEHLIANGADVNYEQRYGQNNYDTPLTIAISHASLNEVKMLVSTGANLNQTLSNNVTPLTWAIRYDFDETPNSIVNYLLQQGADPNLIGCEGKTPLSWAVIIESVRNVQLLIAYGAIINKADEDGETPLTLAKQKGNQEILQMLNVTDDPKASTLKLLNEAIQGNSLDNIKLLSLNKININTSDDEGNTPLQYAIMSGNIEIVEYLMESKVNVCKRGKNGKAPLLVAVETGNVDIVKLLLRHGAGDTIQVPFLEALSLQNLEIIKLLIEHGAVFNINYKDGHTPLTKSIQFENLDIVKALIEHGADVNMPKSDGTSPLALTFKTGNLEICKYLINNNGKLTTNSNESSEYLLKHIEDDNFDMVEILIELGAKLDAIYECGDTPLTKAATLENFEMVKYLVQKEANVNQSNIDGKVPLAIAASNQDIRIAKFLIRSRASLDLAKEEIEEFASFDEEFAIYLKMLEKDSNSCGNNTQRDPLGDYGQEAAP